MASLAMRTGREEGTGLQKRFPNGCMCTKTKKMYPPILSYRENSNVTISVQKDRQGKRAVPLLFLSGIIIGNHYRNLELGKICI